jgi:SAM-dependent methyltransferase
VRWRMRSARHVPERLNSYLGLHAARYDLIYAAKPYANEAAYVADQSGRRAGRLLDVACGTGRHAEAFAELGFDVTGIDYNAQLLAVARERTDGIAFAQADMRALPDPDEPYDVVTCLFDSIGYPLDDESIIAALRSLGRQLAAGGALIFEFLHAPAVLSGAATTRVRRWPTPEGGELLRISETEVDATAGMMSVSYELIESDADGATVARGGERQRNRFFTLAEMRLLLRAAGVALERFVPAYEDGVISAATWHVLAVARAGAPS